MADVPRPTAKHEAVTNPDLPNPLSVPPPRGRTLSNADIEAIAEATGPHPTLSSTPPPLRKIQKIWWGISVGAVRHVAKRWYVYVPALHVIHEFIARGLHR
jgi:hypothetical protein